MIMFTRENGDRVPIREVDYKELELRMKKLKERDRQGTPEYENIVREMERHNRLWGAALAKEEAENRRCKCHPDYDGPLI